MVDGARRRQLLAAGAGMACGAVLLLGIEHFVADIRAGNVPMSPPDKIDPYAAMLLAQTESESKLQAALAPTFGPEEAHRIAFGDELGSCSGTSGGPPPKF